MALAQHRCLASYGENPGTTQKVGHIPSGPPAGSLVTRADHRLQRSTTGRREQDSASTARLPKSSRARRLPATSPPGATATATASTPTAPASQAPARSWQWWRTRRAARTPGRRGCDPCGQGSHPHPTKPKFSPSWSTPRPSSAPRSAGGALLASAEGATRPPLGVAARRRLRRSRPRTFAAS